MNAASGIVLEHLGKTFGGGPVLQGFSASVAPGEAVELELEFRAQLPRVFARTGYAGDFLMVGQWFPKLGVWQDGAWNAYPFHANAEFYADFGTYDVAITLPAGHVREETEADLP